jgi:hypothetical protein
MPNVTLNQAHAIIEAHEELVLAIEDYTNNVLNEKFLQRLREALKKSRILIDQAE